MGHSFVRIAHRAQAHVTNRQSHGSSAVVHSVVRVAATSWSRPRQSFSLKATALCVSTVPIVTISGHASAIVASLRRLPRIWSLGRFRRLPAIRGATKPTTLSLPCAAEQLAKTKSLAPSPPCPLSRCSAARALTVVLQTSVATGGAYSRHMKTVCAATAMTRGMTIGRAAAIAAATTSTQRRKARSDATAQLQSAKQMQRALTWACAVEQTQSSSLSKALRRTAAKRQEAYLCRWRPCLQACTGRRWLAHAHAPAVAPVVLSHGGR